MIRINLIPVKEKKKRQEFFLIACVMAGLFLLVLMMAWIYGLRLGVKTDLKNKIQQVDEESKSYSEKINEIKDLQAKETSLEGIKKTLKTITDSQRKAICALDVIASKIPDGVWLTGITQGKDKDNGTFTLQGYSFSGASLEEFYNSFQKPGSIFTASTLNLMSVSAAVGNNKSIHQFQIITKLVDTPS